MVLYVDLLDKRNATLFASSLFRVFFCYHQVYGPLSMHVTPKTQLARIGLENALTLIQKMTFVCSDPLDFRKLTDKNVCQH